MPFNANLNGIFLCFIMKKSFLFFSIFPKIALAETVLELNRDPVEFERYSQAGQFEQNFAKNLPKPTAYPVEMLPSQNLEQQINHAILSQDWQNLERLLADYSNQAGSDPLLIDYAAAALAYAQKDHSAAILHYQSLLAKNPDLLYPRFDLALILVENQQFRQAELALSEIMPKLPAELAQLATQNLAYIAENERWQTDFYLQYTQTDNVNNAASSPTVNVNGRIFQKDAESLPQSAKGVKYGLGLSKNQNVAGNHFIGLDLRYDSIHYWDNREYREQSLSFSPNYSYRTARYRWGFSPFIEQNWLGSRRYNYQFGATLNGWRAVNEKWSLSSRFTHLQKRYIEPLTASRYNSYLHQVGFGTQWQAARKWRFFANLDGSREIAREKAQSSNKWFARIGALYQSEQWATQANIGYGKRYFADNHYLFGYKRQDKEYQVNAAVWNRKWQWQGIVSKLNFRYQRIDSNIPDFYSRKNQEWFITLEKLF